MSTSAPATPTPRDNQSGEPEPSANSHIESRTIQYQPSPTERYLTAVNSLNERSADASAANATAVKLVNSPGNASQVNKRTTRTTLAITGFSILGLLAVAVFGLSGQGVRDLRGRVGVGAATGAEATITIVPGSGQTLPAPYEHGAQTVGGTATLSRLAPGNYALSVRLGAATSPGITVTLVGGAQATADREP